MATRSQGVLDKMTKESGVEMATLKVFRYRPEVQTEPYVQEYKVPYRRDMVVLDALNYIKDHIDGTLSYRWSCRMGICGSCGANVDGEPKLTCASFLHEFMGPAATALAYRYIADTRDQDHEARFPIVHDKEGVWECTLVGECSVACPKGVDPMLAIQKTKILGATQILKPPRRGK